MLEEDRWAGYETVNVLQGTEAKNLWGSFSYWTQIYKLTRNSVEPLR